MSNTYKIIDINDIRVDNGLYPLPDWMFSRVKYESNGFSAEINFEDREEATIKDIVTNELGVFVIVGGTDPYPFCVYNKGPIPDPLLTAIKDQFVDTPFCYYVSTCIASYLENKYE